jgi:nitrogen-specific signal transduction histidine kinase
MKPATAAAHAVQIKKAEVRPVLDTRANRYEILSRLADDLAHEIKNPLNAIVVNLEVLRRKIEAGAAEIAIDRARVVDQEITRVHTMVDQLLQLMRPGSAESRTISVDETMAELRSVVEAQARAARVALEMSNEAGLFVRAPREAVKFAVLNLIIGVYEVASLQQIAIETAGDAANAEIVIRSTPAAFDEAGEFVQHARAWIEMAGGVLEIGELSPERVGSTSTLRMPACSSFA